MSGAENKGLIARWFEDVWNRGREETIDELFHPDGIAHLGHLEEDLRGPEGVRQIRNMMLAAFPDFDLTVESTLADGDEVGVRWLARGTHDGELMGVPPTHQKARLRGATWARIDNGRIVEIWVNGNFTDVFSRLLKKATSEIEVLRGILPICARCKKIKNDAGYWEQVESYICKHSLAKFSHGFCPPCAKELYPELAD